METMSQCFFNKYHWVGGALGVAVYSGLGSVAFFEKTRSLKKYLVVTYILEVFDDLLWYSC